MSIIPDWAPNLHPLIVHFPIALLFVAALIDTIGLVFKNQAMWKNTAFILYVLGALAAVAAFFTGKAAGDSVFLATEANALLTNHADMAQWVMYFFGGYALIRAVTYFAKLEGRMGIRFVVYLVGLGGLVLVWMTAERGAQMVFQHGVGVQAVSEAQSSMPIMTDPAGNGAPQANEKGGWSWKPTRVAAWMESMTVYGNQAGLTTSILDGGEHGDVLGLTTAGDPVMLTFDFPMQTVQLDAALNLDQFDGSVMFVHHVIDEQNFHFVSISKSEMKLGKSENGDLFLMDNQPFSPLGWSTYRLVSDLTHFRAYADQKLIAHGHGDDPGSGVVGIRLNGTGTVMLDFVQTVSLRGEGLETGTAPSETSAGETAETGAGEAADHEHAEGEDH
jgi:uncharacterized membrane protein